MSEYQNRFDYTPPDYGPETTPEEEVRYSEQQEAIRMLLCDGVERSSLEICIALQLPTTTRVDSRIRDLRKPKHGAWAIDCRRCEDGVYRYQMKRKS